MIDISGSTKEQVLQNFNDYLNGKVFDTKYIPVYATNQTVPMKKPLIVHKTEPKPGLDYRELDSYWRKD